MQGTLRTIGQAPDSYDCGYFAGFALNLVNRYGEGTGSVMFSDEDVYDARNMYLGGGDFRPLMDSSKAVNSSIEMQDYLRVLGCDAGYSSQYFSRLRGEQELRRLVMPRVPRVESRQGALLAIGSIVSGHWICVLGHAKGRGMENLPRLWRGMPNEKVPLLQAALNKWRPELPQLDVDGIFGVKTEARVREFQQAARINVDGIVDQETWVHLDEQTGGHGNNDVYHIYNPLERNSQFLFELSAAEFIKKLSVPGVSLLISPG
ncbi:Putative peptidoglycan binding domain protein [Caulifigura coniformis]|uniref:Peptidoglycan binding domain protein n=1 Tax=Caulifigura coniformis TaxID=2527983 RepID=A0A517SGL4_9PLAN|nr:peptidoglycan-binding domain-containing protein [Caulifigura coniformis]QDT55250.1 Putative peptidoglycan binding domain protein [Caulifigura coniformis]